MQNQRKFQRKFVEVEIVKIYTNFVWKKITVYSSELEPLGRVGTTQVGRGHSGGSGLLELGVALAARVHSDVLDCHLDAIPTDQSISIEHIFHVLLWLIIIPTIDDGYKHPY